MLTRGAIRLILLGWLDRILGSLFGLIKGTIIIFFLVTVLTIFYPKSGPVVEDSRFFPSILSLTEKLTLLIPYKIKDDFLKKKEELQDFWEGRKVNIKKLQKIPDNEKLP
jgi:uncharacterized membrane protein required for colicin V production